MSLLPFFTFCPSVTKVSNPLPSSFTVSTPTCRRYSMPSAFLRPIACFDGNTNTISQSSGATTSPSDGMTIYPSPIALLEKASSAASVIDAAFPLNGEQRTWMSDGLLPAFSLAASPLPPSGPFVSPLLPAKLSSLPASSFTLGACSRKCSRFAFITVTFGP